MYTLTIVFNKDKDKLLMCDHQKLNRLNYVGGKMEPYEVPIEASYRELYEETGISKDDISLQFLRQESTITSVDDGQSWELYITAGILNKEVTLRQEKNPLIWVDCNDWVSLIDAYGNGNCLTYYLEACKLFNIEVSSHNIITQDKTKEQLIPGYINEEILIENDIIREAETIGTYENTHVKQAILIKYSKHPTTSYQRLYNASPNCDHLIQAQFSGIKCIKCGGWYCA